MVSLGYWTVSIVMYSRNYKTTFQKFDLLSFSGENKETLILLGH
jgi:hypothetical protein